VKIAEDRRKIRLNYGAALRKSATHTLDGKGYQQGDSG